MGCGEIALWGDEVAAEGHGTRGTAGCAGVKATGQNSEGITAKMRAENANSSAGDKRGDCWTTRAPRRAKVTTPSKGASRAVGERRNDDERELQSAGLITCCSSNKEAVDN